MLELTKKNIHMDCIKAKAGNQIAIEDDVNIPDLRPDIDKVIFQSGVIRLEEVKPGNDQVALKGSLAVHILYQSEEEEEPFSKIETELPFDELFHMDGVSASDSICVKYELEDLSVGIINSRKISVRVLVTLELLARAIYDEAAAVDVETSLATEYRKKPLNVLETTVCKKDIFRFRHEETIPTQFPNVLEILYASVVPVNLECIPEEGKMMVRGNMRLFFLYTPDGDEESSRYFETTVPLQEEIVCSGLDAQMIPSVGIMMSDVNYEVKSDYDGEDRIIAIEAAFDLDMKAYEEKTYDILADMYCVTKDIQTECKDAMFLQLLQNKQARTRVKERIELEEADCTNLIHHEETVNLEDVEIEEGKLNLSGNMQIRCLYASDPEMKEFHYVERDIPFDYTLDNVDLTGKELHHEIFMQVAQADITMLDPKTIECNATINMNLLLLEEKKETIIVGAEVSDFMPDQMQNLPGMVIYIVKSGDSLWKIGKEYFIPVEEIKRLNELTTDEIHPGDRLLLMKNRV